MKITLLKNQTTDTDGSQKSEFWVNSTGGRVARLIAEGTFDGATVGLEIRDNSASEWIALIDSQMTAAGAVVVNSGGFYVRGSVSSAGASTSVTLSIGI